jgi:outer membrane protein, heavy metal efflux system
MIKRLIPTLALLLVGCVHYVARPLNPRVSADQLQSRRLDSPEVVARINALMPRRDSASTWPPAAYGVTELVTAGLALNPELAESRARLQAAIAAVTTARALPSPTLGLAFDRYLHSQADSAAWAYGFSLDIPLSAISNRRLQTALADSGVRAARLDYADLIWRMRSAVRGSLQEVLVSRAQHALMLQLLSDNQTLTTAYERRLAEGEATPAERQQAATAALQAQRDLAGSERRLNSAYAQLAQAIGVGTPAILKLPLEWSDFDTPLAPKAADFEALRERALLGRSEVERALAEYDARELELRLQVRAQYPQLTLGPGYTYDHGIKKLNFNASLSLPLSRNAGEIAAAEARRSAAGARLEVAQNTVLVEIDGANASLDSALRALQQARQQRELAEQVAGRTGKGFRVGNDDRVALLSAQVVAGNAGLAALAALDEAQHALAALEDAVRSPLNAAELALPSGSSKTGTSQ